MRKVVRLLIYARRWWAYIKNLLALARIRQKQPFSIGKVLLVVVFCSSGLYAQRVAENLNIFKKMLFPVNSSKHDFCATFSPDGKTMIFGSNRGSKYQDLYLTRYHDRSWSKPINLKLLNSPYNDETPFWSRDGKKLIFSSDRDGSVELPRDSRGRVRITFDLYWSNFDGKSFGKPVAIPGQVNSRNHEKAPSLSSDNKTLYYTIREFGKPASWVVKATWNKNGFYERKPLPEIINSNNYETAFIPAIEQGVFFFSSKRSQVSESEATLGDFDIYRIEYKDDKWTNLQHLPAPINSSASDAYYRQTPLGFAFSSNRESKNKDFNLYYNKRPLVIELDKLKKDDTFITHAIHFDANSDQLRADSFDYLNNLASYIKINTTLKMKIIGHTDLHGDDEYNVDLSRRRAESVKKYLVQKGVQPKNLVTYGAGKSNPLIKKLGDPFDAKNRRTEFKILDK